MTAKHLSKNDRKNQIIEAALNCFYEKGYVNTTIDDIGEKCGLSKGSIYWHFKKKDEILYEAIKIFTQSFEDELSHLMSDQLSHTNKLKEGVQMFVLFQSEHQGMFNLLVEFWAQSRDREEVKSHWNNLLGTFRQAIEGIIKDGILQGEFKPIDTQSFVWAFMATLDGLGAYLSFVDDLDIDKIMNVYFDTLLSGLKKNI